MWFVVGDSRIWFFFRATDFEPTTVPIVNLSDIPEDYMMNLYYSKVPGTIKTPYWWPLHNSYDSYEGHVFEQVSWTEVSTTRAFAKSNKLVHQKPAENAEEPCINITKDGPDGALVGENITYEFTITNCGNVDLNNVTVNDTLLGDAIWSAATLSVGESVTFTVQHTVTDTDPDPLVNTATASGQYNTTTVTKQASHSVDITEAANPCIDITKEGPAEALVDENITYEFTVSNCGNVGLNNVTVNDTLLGDAIWSAATLSVGESVTFTVQYTVTDTDPDPLVNTATASGWYDGQEVTDEASHNGVIIDSAFSLHICGLKFDDLNRNGKYDIETEPGIDGIMVTLLGPDKTTPAEIYYTGKFSYPSPEANPLDTGENGLMGSYCFNLENVMPGTYTFYIKEEVLIRTVATTPTLVGPVTLVASDTGPRESLNNPFGNVKPTPPLAVGGGFVTG